MASARILRIGTRASPLATWQANWVADQLRAQGHPVQIEFVRTTGDATESAIVGSGATGVFTRELQAALRDHHVDLAVHSLKDLPTATPDGLIVAAVPVRASPFDALVSLAGHALDALPAQSRIGTGSPRRESQIKFARPDVLVQPIRGNVDTRLHKLDHGEFDAIILAEAGLDRLGLAHRISQRLPPEVCLPAPAQGALAIEARRDDAAACRAAGSLNHAASEMAVTVERNFLATMEGGCSAPIGAWCHLASGRELHLHIVVVNPTATERLARTIVAEPTASAGLGQTAAQWALDQGAAAWCV